MEDLPDLEDQEEVPETPQPVALRLCTVILEENREVDFEYPVGLFEIVDGESVTAVAVILVSQLESRLVCAFPFSSWNRIAAKRVLPAGELLRPTSVQVEFVDRASPSEETVFLQKVWLGILPAEFESLVAFDSSVEQVDPDIPFDNRGPTILPSAAALAAAFEQHFAFASATSGEPRRRGTPKADLDSRLSLLETSFAELATDVEKALTASRPPALRRSEPAPKPSFGQQCPPPGLGPNTDADSELQGANFEVVSAARNAGIPEEQIKEMVRLAMKGKTRLDDLPRPKAAPKASNPLSDSEEEAVDAGAFQLDQDVTQPDLQISSAIAKLTEIAGHLTSQKKRGHTLEALLEGSGALGSGDGASVGTSRKNAAALRALRRTLQRNPAELVKVLERNMEEDFAMRTQMPGSSAVPTSARAWLELRSRVQGYQTPLRLLWSIAGILDALRAGAVDEAKARCYLGLAMGDQLSIDRGQWVLAGEVSLEDPPAVSVFASHNLPTELEAPYSKLLDARWVDLFLHKLNEFDLLNEKKKKLAYRGGRHPIPSDDSAAASVPTPNPKKQPKPPRGGKGKDGKGCRRCWFSRSSPSVKLIRHDEQELTAVGTGEGSFVCATPSAEYSGSGLLDFVGLASPSADRVAERGEPCAEPDCPPDVFQDACAAPSHCDRSGADVSTSLPRSSTGAAAFPQPPGARAETVGVGQLWNSQTRWLLRSRAGSLRKFFLSTFSAQTRKPRRGCTSRPVWPMPLPPISSKTNSDDRGEGRALQSMVICLNWLHLGSPSRVPADYEPLAAMTGEQRGVLQRLKRLSSCWLDCPMITAADMGRTAGKVESLQDSLARLTSSAAAILKSFDYRTNMKKPPENKEQPAPSSQTMVAEVQLAKEVEADRLSFGGRPCFHPSQLLNQRSRQIFDAPLDHSLHPSESPDAPPRAHVRGARNELIKLLHKLDDTGRLALFGPHQVRLGHRAGVFCLIKNQQQDRLILDLRGANLLEEGLVDWTQTMASPMPLLDIILQEGEHLEASGEDLRDYYYLYAVSEQRAARNSIALNLTPAEARKFKSFSSAPAGCPFYVPALRTLAMGDINAVEYGQQSHMVLALQAGFKMDEICTMHGKCPRHRWFAGIIIDDFVLVEKVVTASPGAKVSAELADMMVDSYLSHGLQPHEKKRFREQTDAKFWGAQISGTKGLIRAQLERTIPICHITAQLCRLGVSNRKLLEVLAGSWVSILQFRRRGMCLLAEVFDVIQAHDYMETFPLPPVLVDELWSLVLLAPTFCTDLRTQPVAELSLVDAWQKSW